MSPHPRWADESESWENGAHSQFTRIPCIGDSWHNNCEQSMDLNEFTRALTHIKHRRRARAREREILKWKCRWNEISKSPSCIWSWKCRKQTTLSPKRNLLVQQIVDENPINVNCHDESKITNKKPQVSEISLVSRGDGDHKEHTKMRTEFNHNGNLR